jgi:hypothetical protein
MNMKVLKNILAFAVVILLASACNEWIDPISYVAPGTDESAPTVTITYPVEGSSIQVPEFVGSVNIKFIATDDIELKTVSILMDGVEIVSFNQFLDYRRLVKEYLYTSLTNGEHTLSITATDLTDKSTTSTVHFTKKPPYEAKYDGEIFYMPFDGDYVEKISFNSATEVGSPGFAGESRKGLNAYKGATDSYLTFPTTGLTSGEFSAAFWYKVNASPDLAGILNSSPTGQDRTKGFRLFREGNASLQRIKLNVGYGGGETWNDGQEIAAPATDWVHIAFTVSASKCIIYINGSVAAQVDNAGEIDWTGCDVLTIGSGKPNYTYWNHFSDLSYYDELRFFNKAISQTEILTIIADDSPYVPKYSGEIFYMPFEGTYRELVSNEDATVVGAPGFETGKVGQAYAGATDAYLTFPTTELVKSSSLSAVFWMKINATPDRAGILVASPIDALNPGFPAIQNKRTDGFRFFRENSGGLQQIKVNVGIGTGESWNDGGLVDPSTGEWVHIAFTISNTASRIYINGVLAREATFATPMTWSGCDLLCIMSGVPRFTEWNHYSDLSLMDELRIFNKELTQADIQAIIDDEN